MYRNEKEKNNSYYRDCKAITDNLSRIYKLSLQGAVGDATKKQRLSSLVRRKSERQAIFKFVLPLASKGIEGIKYIFNLIRRSLEFFAFAKNRDDSLLFLASPRTCFSEIATSASRLLAMTPTTLALAAVLFVGIASKARAECVGATETTAGTDAVSGAHCGICGTNCNWKIEGDTLKITGGTDGSTGVMDDYIWNNEAGDPTDSAGNKRPWSEYKNVITSAEITNVSNIGKRVFHGFGNLTNVQIGNTVEIIGESSFDTSGLTSINFPDSVTKIERGAFWYAPNLEEVSFSNALIDIEAGAFNGCKKLTEVTLPENLKYLGGFANTGIVNFYVPDNVETIRTGTFSDNDLLYVNIPDTITKLELGAFGSNLADMPDIICRGSEETCSNLHSLLSNYMYFDDGWKKADISQKMSIADYSQCYGTNYFWNGTACVREPDVSKRKCCTSCKDMGGWCNRIRYTPAEAAAVLHDDNTNSVTITFKK